MSESERELFTSEIMKLTKLASVKHGWFGKPAATDRPVIDRSYDYALVVDVGDAAGHDAWQTDPGHLAVRNVVGGMWDRILIYDVEG